MCTQIAYNCFRRPTRGQSFSTTVCCKTFKCYGALSSFQLLLKSGSQPAVVLELHISNIKVSHWRSPLGHLWAYLKPTWSLLGANMVHPGAHLAPSVHPKRQLDGTLLKVSHWRSPLGHLWAYLEPTWSLLGVFLEPSGPILVPVDETWRLILLSWPSVPCPCQGCVGGARLGARWKYNLAPRGGWVVSDGGAKSCPSQLKDSTQ